MRQEKFLADKAVLEADKYMPSVSVIMPFEPKMSAKKDLEHRLQLAINKAEKDVMKTYPAEQYTPVMTKLRALVHKLDFNTYKQSVALYVSPVMEKIYYLDIPVEEKIIIDESFEIRDLVYSKKDIHKYLILVLSNNRSHVFLGNTTLFARIASNRPEHLAAIRKDMPERVANFSDPQEKKEIQLEKFLRFIDNGLGIILSAYPLPLFVMGTDKTVGHFKKISHNADRITGCVHGNFDEASEADIRKAIAPHVSDWKKIKQQDLLQRLDAAMSAKKLAMGFREVWKDAHEKRGRLLVLEKNFMLPVKRDQHGEIADAGTSLIRKAFQGRDAVDDIIELVLANGGDVEFVDEGLLKDYRRIVLMRYY